MSDWGIGDDRHYGFEATGLNCGGFGLWHQRHLATEDEGEVGQDAEAGDSVDGTFERRFKQRGVGDRFTDRLATGAVIGGKFWPIADVAEVALVDLEGFRQGDRQ